MQKLNVCVQTACAQGEAVRANCAARRRAAALALLPALSAHADAPDFRCRPLLAGKASLTEPGFVVRRELGVAALAPELRIPVELVTPLPPRPPARSASAGAVPSWSRP